MNIIYMILNINTDSYIKDALKVYYNEYSSTYQEVQVILSTHGD